MSKPLIVVTGKNGQLGWELSQQSPLLNEVFEFLFVDADILDLSKPEIIPSFFQKYQPQYFIHCGAYTAVDKAETEQELAYKINAESVGVIARECALIHCPLITISTDYVFDGNGTTPYQPDQQTNPLNYYGYSKWMGEKLALANWAQTIIIRTAWVYSSHAHNFVKTMLRLMKERTEIKVVNDQVGCPTYAADLAAAILQVVQQLHSGNKQYGIYHYTNTGIISWYDFAVAIKTLSGSGCNVLPVPAVKYAEEYPTSAKRPAYSVMDTQKIAGDFKVQLVPWQPSLQRCLEKLMVL
jgi:dTDP-4-dehydrorhamnose reductase